MEDLPYFEIEKLFQNLLGPFEEPARQLNPEITEEKELDGDVIQQRIEENVKNTFISMNPSGIMKCYGVYCNVQNSCRIIASVSP